MKVVLAGLMLAGLTAHAQSEVTLENLGASLKSSGNNLIEIHALGQSIEVHPSVPKANRLVLNNAPSLSVVMNSICNLELKWTVVGTPEGLVGFCFAAVKN